MEHICYENQCLTLFPTKTIYFSKKNVFFSSWDFILKQWRRGQHWRKLKVRFRFTETPFLPNHRTLPKPCFCRTSKPKPKFRSYTNFQPPSKQKLEQYLGQQTLQFAMLEEASGIEKSIGTPMPSCSGQEEGDDDPWQHNCFPILHCSSSGVSPP